MELKENKEGFFKEAEWFDLFYPDAWGNWRESFNIKAKSVSRDKTGCCFSDYFTTGHCTGFSDSFGRCDIKPPLSTSLNSFFVIADSNYHDIIPIYQPIIKKSYYHVTAEKITSNIDLFRLTAYGEHGSNISKLLKDFYTQKEMNLQIDRLKNGGKLSSFYKSRG